MRHLKGIKQEISSLFFSSILIFICSLNFMSCGIEHEESFITSELAITINKTKMRGARPALGLINFVHAQLNWVCNVCIC